MPLLHCPDYCSFVISFEIETCEGSTFVLFQDCLGYSVSFELKYLKKLKDTNTSYIDLQSQHKPCKNSS